MKRTIWVGATAGFAALAAIGNPIYKREKRNRQYSEFCGPPWPTTRQQRRALERKAKG